MCAGEYLYAFDRTTLLLICYGVQKEGGQRFCEFCHLKPGYTHFTHVHTEIALSRCEKGVREPILCWVWNLDP